MCISKLFIFLIISGLITWACTEEKSENISTSQNNISRVIDSITIFHKTLDVRIALKAYPEFWKKETIPAQDSSQIVSLLVEDGQKVSDNEFLLSLWQLSQSKDFTPVDIRAPFAGIIGKVFVQIGSKPGKGKPLLFIYNADFLSVKTKMNQAQIRILKKNQKVISGSAEYSFDGYIESVDKRDNSVNMLLDNTANQVPLSMISLDIICENVSGDFIRSDLFKNKKIIAYIDDESTFEITAIAVSDSLSLISPGLPHLSSLSVIDHNK